MKTFKIIPAIDIIDGKCVRLTRGDYLQKKIYSEDPVEVAKNFENYELKYLHLVDLDGAKSGSIVNQRILKEISTQTSLLVDFGGGIKTERDMETAFENGANQVNIGSMAVKNKALFLKCLKRYGPDKIILSADVMNEDIAISGWQENSGIGIFDFIKEYLHEGVQNLVCTDVSKDGTLLGPAIELYLKILDRFPDIRLIASGGVSCLQDIEALAATDVEGVIVGKAIYENRIELKDLQKYVD
jgi:phosphoribosylformimino-5-aminoimidazole carboxamide ribotide isomerase